MLRARRLFVEVDDSSNRMQKKIKLAQDQKVPYMLVLGDREVEARTAAPRTRAGEQLDADRLGGAGRPARRAGAGTAPRLTARRAADAPARASARLVRATLAVL